MTYDLSSARVDRPSKLYWLSIDVSINNIIRQQRMIPSNLVVRTRPLSLQFCVLHGVGTVANALTVGENGMDIDHFAVNIAALVQEESPFHELYRLTKMIWNEANPNSPRLEIYVQNLLLSRLVELYVTKRIDAVGMFMQIAVTESTASNTNTIAEIPLLDNDGHLYFRRAQCELLSVYASSGLSAPRLAVDGES